MRRTVVFVDHANLNACVRNRGLEVDYYDLKDYLAQEQEGRMPLEAFCYVAIDPRNEHRLDREVLRMQEDGWMVKSKLGAPRPDGGFKCNVDVEMAIDIIAFAYDAKPDIVVIVSGDQDFAAVVRKLRERGVRVEASSKKLLLPSSQAHAVRESLFSEHLKTQEAEWAFLMNTYRDFAAQWRKVSADSPSLYVDLEKTGKDGVFHHYTHFLDALEAAKFEAPGREKEKGSSRDEEATA